MYLDSEFDILQPLKLLEMLSFLGGPDIQTDKLTGKQNQIENAVFLSPEESYHFGMMFLSRWTLGFDFTRDLVLK